MPVVGHAATRGARLATPLQSAAGALLFAAGIWTLAVDLPAWNAIWYVPAWYGYLLFVDALTARVGGRSLVAEPGVLAPMLFWSVPFWFLFEAFNLALRNWYYVFVLRTDWLQFVISWLAFATVFPACFFHVELLRSLRAFEARRWPRLAVGPRLELGLACWGALSIALPLIAPRYAFWMVWGAALWLPELANRRLGAPSWLSDLERGRPARVLRLLAGGALAGIVWEALNFWARCKWIYTVPGFETGKLFEMPWPGFLGFPLLSVSASSTYALLTELVRGGRHWDAPARSHAKDRSPWVRITAALAAIAGTVVVFTAVLEQTVASRRPLLIELDDLRPEQAARLALADVETPERLDRAARRGRIEDLAAATGIDRPALHEAARHASLALHKGMGADRARQLAAIGVESVGDLYGRTPDALLDELRRAAAAGGIAPATLPRRAEVAVWIRAAGPDDRARR